MSAEKLNPLAQQLLERLEAAAPEVASMLSPMGRRLYFPKGILSQGAEAKARAHRMNATIGIATESREPMTLPSMMRHVSDIAPVDAVQYAPPAGRASLRKRWREKLVDENPSLRDRAFGLPIVTQAITHGLSLVADLFVGEGDCVIVPDKLWGNYRLLFEVRHGARIATFPFFDKGGFDTAGFERALAENAEGREKLVVLLNFPNNPTGYTPTPAEGLQIASLLESQARRGTQIVAVLDDAYFGLFFHLGGESMTQSLFGALTGRHPNLLAVKLDGATKELFAWGLRCGFMTFGPGRADTAEETCAVLEAKSQGAIRSAISNASMLSQTLVERALESSSVDGERKQKAETLRARAALTYEIANQPRFRESFETYPFNSGYFMCVRTLGADAEQVRLRLLDEYGIGVVATSATDLRIAFSCLELEEIEPLFESLHKAITETK